MKLLLIRPNSRISGPPPPLGLGYLSHAVKKTRGDDVLIIEGRKHRLSEDQIIERGRKYAPDLIGITAMTFEAGEATSLISRLKAECPEIPIVIGGPHATTVGPDLLYQINADYLVTGEGEDTLVDLLNGLEGKREISKIMGLAWRNAANEVIFNGVRPYIEDLDRLGVDWEAIEPREYFGIWNRNAMLYFGHSNRRLPVFTSRGCPMRCTYCCKALGRKYRTRSIDRVVTEMIELRDRYDVHEFELTEDILNLDMQRAKDFMREIIDRKLGCHLTIPSGLRADRMDDELLSLMVKAGIYYIGYAIESASDRIQELVRKKVDLKRAREVVNMTAERRVVTGTNFMFGFPGETKEELDQTVEYAISLSNHIAHFLFLTPFLGTEIAEFSPEIKSKVRQIDIKDFYSLSVNLSAVSDEVLINTKRNAVRRFYFSPVRIARIARDVPKNLRFLGSALLALKLALREDVRY